MLPLIKCCIRARLTTEKLKKLEPMGKFDIYLISMLISSCGVAGVIILFYYLCDELRCLGGRVEVGVSIFVIAILSCLYLEKSHYYEKTKEYLDTLDEMSFQKLRRHNITVVWVITSVYLITLVVVVVKFIMDRC